MIRGDDGALSLALWGMILSRGPVFEKEGGGGLLRPPLSYALYYLVIYWIKAY